jgi:adenine-specific DNA-methyltransferase
MKNNLILFKDKMDKMDLIILNKSFEELDYDADAFYYLDPPYLLTNATYNTFWDESKEEYLLKILSQANFKFALSNVIEYNGKTNNLLKEAVKENNWNVIPIESDYSNNTPNQKKRVKNNEVLITNY